MNYGSVQNATSSKMQKFFRLCLKVLLILIISNKMETVEMIPEFEIKSITCVQTTLMKT